MNRMTLVCKSIGDIEDVASKIAAITSHSDVVAFYGSMGAGKTTLIKAICKHLGVIDTVSSPTFSIVNEYFSSKNDMVYHFDFYRIKNTTEAMDLGYEHYLFSGKKCFIEWPEQIEELLDFPHACVYITVDGEARHIKIDY